MRPLRADLLDFEESMQLTNASWMAHFAKGFCFDLPDAFPSDSKLAAHFFKRA
jgi:hypothetical protein